MRWFAISLGLLAVIIILIVLLVGAASNGYSFLGALNSLDVAVISLGAATLSVTCVAVVVGVAALAGYGEIKRAAIDAAQKIVMDKIAPLAMRAALEATRLKTGGDEGDQIAAAQEDGHSANGPVSGTPGNRRQVSANRTRGPRGNRSRPRDSVKKAVSRKRNSRPNR